MKICNNTALVLIVFACISGCVVCNHPCQRPHLDSITNVVTITVTNAVTEKRELPHYQKPYYWESPKPWTTNLPWITPLPASILDVDYRLPININKCQHGTNPWHEVTENCPDYERK